MDVCAFEIFIVYNYIVMSRISRCKVTSQKLHNEAYCSCCAITSVTVYKLCKQILHIKIL